jgi:hypothetical protein
MGLVSANLLVTSQTNLLQVSTVPASPVASPISSPAPTSNKKNLGFIAFAAIPVGGIIYYFYRRRSNSDKRVVVEEGKELATSP